MTDMNKIKIKDFSRTTDQSKNKQDQSTGSEEISQDRYQGSSGKTNNSEIEETRNPKDGFEGSTGNISGGRTGSLDKGLDELNQDDVETGHSSGSRSDMETDRGNTE